MSSQWINDAESRGGIEGLAKSVCSLIEGNIFVLHARITGPDRGRVMSIRGAHVIESIDMAIAGLYRLKDLVSETAGCPATSTGQRESFEHANMYGMKRIRQIIEALRVITTTPSEKIASAWMTIQHNLKEDASTPRIMEHVMLIHKIVGAVVEVAKEMERPAKAEEPKS